MAMYAMLRCASSLVLPQVFSTVGSPRTFQSALCAARAVERVGFTREYMRRIFVPSMRFTDGFASKRSADENLIRIIESEIDCAEEDKSFLFTAKECEICDFFVYIPQYGPGTASLNVTVAASIVLYHFGVWAGLSEI